MAQSFCHRCGTYHSPTCDELKTMQNFKPAVQPPGRKDDGGKLDMTLLDDMPRALKAIVAVMQWAITEKKPVPYERGSWLGVDAQRYRAADGRHNLDAAEQASRSGQSVRFERDLETNKLHLAHKACSMMMALELTLREMEKNDATATQVPR